MSNLIAGDIFQKIIEDVVSASQTDFEENGVNQQTLVELQQTWQQKLSARSVAQMPWDPKPPPPVPQSTAPSQGSTPVQGYTSANQHQQNGAPRIKAEPGTENHAPHNNYQQQPMNPALAQERAASLLQQQFGSQASASIGALQQRGIALPGQQKGPGNIQLPGQSQQQYAQAQYAQQIKQQTATQQPRIKQEDMSSQQNGNHFHQQPKSELGYAQTDGGGDAVEEWAHVMQSTRALSDEQVAKNDHEMRHHVAELSQRFESGLMAPLSQQQRHQTSRKRKLPARETLPSAGPPSFQPAAIPQLDGDFDEEDKAGIKDEEDEDAINSDLDSSGEEDNAADDDDEDIDSMLCTYDKVQRVKNKWKCTLKDGVLSANGKEYLFHKAQGEFEW